MTRTDGDTWDLASSVGATATMVATARALASKESDAIIEDPFAEPLVRAVGIDFFTRMLDNEHGDAATDSSTQQLADVLAVRTRFFDDFFLDAARAGIRQAVILASGLDSRGYRLPWPADMVVFEIDQPEVIDFKTATLARVGATPTAARRTVAVDLRDDWPAALQVHGFDPNQPTAWSAEGLLLYLPADAQDRLFDHVTELSAPGSRLATEDYPDRRSGISERFRLWGERWERLGLDLKLGDLIYLDDHKAVDDYLDQLGWHVDARTRAEIFAAYGRSFGSDELSGTLGTSLNITAIRK
jgi:methyltransferase (TIGR00027 family)